MEEEKKAIVSVDLGGVIEAAAAAGMSASVSINLFPRDEEELAPGADPKELLGRYTVLELPEGAIMSGEQADMADYVIVGGVVVKNRHGPVHGWSDRGCAAGRPSDDAGVHSMQDEAEGPGQRRDRLAKRRELLTNDLLFIERIYCLIGSPLPPGHRILAQMGERRAGELAKDMCDRINVIQVALMTEIESISAELDD